VSLRKKTGNTLLNWRHLPGLGSGDGLIHTALFRLPLDCLSTRDLELEPIHRFCRGPTATYARHRMLVHTFRFLKTAGGKVVIPIPVSDHYKIWWNNHCAYYQSYCRSIRKNRSGIIRASSANYLDGRNVLTTGAVRIKTKPLWDWKEFLIQNK
jgi:hypothetical protein